MIQGLILAYISLSYHVPSLDHSPPLRLSFNLPTFKLFHGKAVCTNCFLCLGNLPPPPLHSSNSIRSQFIISFLKGCCPRPFRTVLVPSTLHPHCRLPFSFLSSTFFSLQLLKITIWAMFNISSSCFMRAGITHLAYSSIYSYTRYLQ